jgi:GntR family transcriptional regulator
MNAVVDVVEQRRAGVAVPRFTLDQDTSEPIYLQLASQIRRQVASGSLMAGDEVPSVRHLAQDLGVSPMTVSKAYQLLESQGSLVRRRGRTLVVSASPLAAARPQTELLQPTLERAAQEAFELGLSADQALTLFASALRKREVRT